MHDLKVELWAMGEGRGQQILFSKANCKTVQNCQSKSPKHFWALEINERQTIKREPFIYEKLLEFR